MKLNSLYTAKKDSRYVFESYMRRLKKLIGRKQILNEGRKIITTVEIVDDEEKQPAPVIQPVIQPVSTIEIEDKTRDEFIDKAKKLGEFDNPIWVEQLVNGVKQAGAQGVNVVPDGDQPVSRNDIRNLIDLLIGLVDNGRQS